MITKVVIFVVLIVGGWSVQSQSGKKADSNRRPTRVGTCPYTITKYHDKFKKTKNNIAVDLNPNRIPSLSDPSKTIGLLRAKDINLANRCFERPFCDPNAKYRSMDGSCNNLLFPVWGQAQTAVARIINANYSDGINQIRKAVSGRELPNVRHIRKTLFKNEDTSAPDHSLLAMQFGQLVAHDAELVMPKTLSDGRAVECCNPDGSTPYILPNECLPIPIPPEESVISKNRCFSLPRVSDTLDMGCQITPVRQRIGVSSFLDASMLYGSDNATANSLRSFVNGKLKVQMGSNGRSFLPNVPKPTKACNVPNDNTVCYLSGDIRVSQQPDLAATTTSFMRLHNVLCNELQKLNPSWIDEKLYQEARKILIAMYQHVIYNEFLPVLIGKDFARVNQLLSLKSGFDNNYNEFLNPTTLSSFTGAAFRSFHSYIQGIIEMVDENRNVTSKIRLRDYFFKPDIVQEKDNYDSFTRGLLTQHSQEQDEFYTEEVTDFIFRIQNKTIKKDLVTLDLIRGRDYGEPAYNSFRQLCGLNKAMKFEDLSDQISKKNIDALASVYEDVNDIDFFVAGILEKFKPGAKSGHTFQCIVGEMFYRWKYGDRFFYEFPNQPGSFTLDQLNEIRKTKLALIVCMTSDIKNVQEYALNVPSLTNPLVPCKSLTKLNFSSWQNV